MATLQSLFTDIDNSTSTNILSDITANTNNITDNTNNIATLKTTYFDVSADTSAETSTFYICDTSTSAITITLPVASDDATVTILDDGNASTNNITIITADTSLIRSAESFIMNNNFQKQTFLKRGTDWKVY